MGDDPLPRIPTDIVNDVILPLVGLGIIYLLISNDVVTLDDILTFLTHDLK